MKQFIIAIAFAVASTAVSAQTPGMPTQSGGQEPEVPGSPPPSSNQQPAAPENVPVPEKAQPPKHDRKDRIEKHTKCVPGQDAKKCRDEQRGRK
ncbi:hypothetical protein ECB98_17930 [Brucellaceae bacterium VT-16-1752]|uniref:Uncharacterized protein n=1 Tax=Ochrobactrum soli TaxID=2448455 RepID=A0A849KHM2_9HYPH|nr:hypothetical protein [[Ochrobactrum] soli]NNU61195.1 hypothetical protein [[Ochrobactrum] soli]RRD22995.1 hypothetical protein ECB98_17930 [Brucellaceae bacterium VT-16-1752]